ncbi:MAG: hypothetical protein NT077_04605 [Candidatus Taylorbacteria bacterium]|nr:hypothetical protein [Candidatus Taylorbacteria bacterium]
MNFTRTKFVKLIRIVLLVIVLVVIVGYAVFRSLPYVRGPEIMIFQPINGSTIDSTTMTIAGRAIRVNSLTMNNNVIPIDESGNFKETVIVFPGINIISFDVTDQFKRSAHSELRVFGARLF